MNTDRQPAHQVKRRVPQVVINLELDSPRQIRCLPGVGPASAAKLAVLRAEGVLTLGEVIMACPGVEPQK